VTSGVKVAIGGPAVMHTDSPIARQDANRIQRGRATCVDSSRAPFAPTTRSPVSS
jgi:hypothetical protein